MPRDRQVGPGRRRRGWGLRVLQEKPHRSLGPEHELPGQEPVGDTADRVDVGAAVHDRLPIACSGAMNAGVPWTAFSCVSAGLVSAGSRAAFTIPKSSTFTKS